AVALAVLAGTVLPVARSLRSHGVSGLTIQRRPGLHQRVVGLTVGALGGAAVLWGVLLAALGTARLGVCDCPVAIGAIGWVLYAAGLLLVLVAQAQMGGAWRIGVDVRPTELVTRGLYAYVRNPIYAGMMLLGAGLAALTPSPWTLGCAVVYAAIIRVQTSIEERHLLSLHGDAYRAYLARAGRFVPGVGRG
ncbi:MAG: methyltransferase family protein, partial [Polyangiaceae bacterium]